MMLSAQQMRSLPDFFLDIPDPRRAQGRRHPCLQCWPLRVGRSCVACAATKRWPTGRKVSAPKPETISLPRVNGRYLVPSESIMRNVMIRVDPTDLDRSLQCWNQAYGQHDTTSGHRRKNHVQRPGSQRPSNPCHERGRPSHQGLLHPKKVGCSANPGTISKN